jgi:hypothetical protein
MSDFVIRLTNIAVQLVVKKTINKKKNGVIFHNTTLKTS